MEWLEPRTSGVGSDSYTNRATTTALLNTNLNSVFLVPMERLLRLATYLENNEMGHFLLNGGRTN